MSDFEKRARATAEARFPPNGMRTAFVLGARWAVEQAPKVEITRELNRPATCKVWQDGALIFDGRDYSADQEERIAAALAFLRGETTRVTYCHEHLPGHEFTVGWQPNEDLDHVRSLLEGTDQ